jgi:hypothetical protein
MIGLDLKVLDPKLMSKVYFLIHSNIDFTFRVILMSMKGVLRQWQHVVRTSCGQSSALHNNSDSKEKDIVPSVKISSYRAISVLR